jgi:hypothetical protein
MADIADVDLEWRILLAKDGDGELLAELLHRNEPIHPTLRKFLAEVVAGKIRLKPPRKLTYKSRSRQYLREQMVVWFVEHEMSESGKRRDKDLRTELTQKWCKANGTTVNAVADFQRYQKSRVAKRRASARK